MRNSFKQDSFHSGGLTTYFMTPNKNSYGRKIEAGSKGGLLKNKIDFKKLRFIVKEIGSNWGKKLLNTSHEYYKQLKYQ